MSSKIDQYSSSPQILCASDSATAQADSSSGEARGGHGGAASGLCQAGGALEELLANG
jgi:hypothetical protein